MRSLALLAPLVMLACPAPQTRGPAPLWSSDASSADNPFPDERWLVDGAFRVPQDRALAFMPYAALTFEAEATFRTWDAYVNEAGGWGVAAPVAVRFAARLDSESISAGALAFIAGERAFPASARYIDDPGYLLIAPVTPLPPSARVVVVIQRSLLSGSALASPADFDPASADAVAAARILGVPVDDIALTFAYRTAAPADAVADAFAIVRSSVPPATLAAPVAPSALPDDLRGHADDFPAGAAVVVGTLDSLDLRDESLVWPDDLATAQPHAETLQLLVALPDPARFPPPWPAVIAQHGFAGDRTFGLDVAARFLERGMAVLSTDASSHGERGSFLGFLRVDDPRIARDHLRQTMVDLMQLANLVESGGVDGVDGAHPLSFFGHSMGTLVGGALLAVDERYEVAVINAPGASFYELFQGERIGSATALLLRPALGLGIDDPSYWSALPFCTSYIQTLMEPADPLATPQGPPTLFQMSLGDRTLPNAGTLQLMKARGVVEKTVAADGPPVDVLWVLDPADFDFDPNDDPHGMHTFSGAPGIHVQAAEFVASGGRHLTDPTE